MGDACEPLHGTSENASSEVLFSAASMHDADSRAIEALTYT